MNMHKKSLVAVSLAVVAVAIAGGMVLRARPSPPVASPAAVPAPKPASPDELKFLPGAPQLAMIHSQVLPAVAIPVAEALSARVAYDDDVTARIAVGVSGRVVAIKAAPGDRVKAGQVLAEIDSPDFGSALADLNKARADEERKHQVLERAGELVPGEAISRKDWEAAQADYVQARAESLRAAQRVRNINPNGVQVQGQRIRLSSPVSGVVTERTITPALEVSPGMPSPLFVLTDPKRLWLMIDVPEAMLASVKLGGGVDVESDAFPGEHFKATVAQLGQVVDPNTRRVVVRAQLDNPAGKLLPEMFVRCSLLQKNGSAVNVPNSALVNRGLYTYVFVQPSPGRFVRRQIKMLTHGGDASYVGEGVSGGENIVTAGALLLDAEMSAQPASAQ